MTRLFTARIGKSLLCVLALTLLGASAAQARTYTVNNRTDPKPGACTPTDCTLREAVIAANKHARRRHDRAAEPQDATSSRSPAPARTRPPTAISTSAPGPLRIVHPGRAPRRSTPTGSTASSTSARRRPRSTSSTIRGGFSSKTDGDGDGGGIVVGDFGDAPLTILRSRIIHNRAPWVGANGGGIDSDSSASSS